MILLYAMFFYDVIEWLVEAIELAHKAWDNLKFDFQPTHYIYFMKCDQGGTFSKGELKCFGNIEWNPYKIVSRYCILIATEFVFILIWVVYNILKSYKYFN
jgi:hypothetical protein